MAKQLKKKSIPQATSQAKIHRAALPPTKSELQKEVETTNTTTAEVKKEVPGTTTFGLQGLMHPTPLWMIRTFQTQFVLNKALVFWLTATKLIHNVDTLKEYLLLLATVDLAVWTAARFTGVKKSDFEGL